jgi:hypothetical protein
VVSDWIAANDIHILTDSAERTLLGATWDERPNPLDYDVSMRRVRKIQAATIAAISRTISKRIRRIVTNAITPLRNQWAHPTAD